MWRAIAPATPRSFLRGSVLSTSYAAARSCIIECTMKQKTAMQMQESATLKAGNDGRKSRGGKVAQQSRGRAAAELDRAASRL